MPCRCSNCFEGHAQLLQPEVAHVVGSADETQASFKVDTPAELQRAYTAMLTYARPSRSPTLMCRNRVAQVGRWFAQGVLVLGLEDTRDRAVSLKQNLHMLQNQGRWPQPIPSLDDLNRFAQIQVLAHELGHELDRHDQRHAYFQGTPESKADSWAGWLEGQRPGSDEELGAVFFESLGCNRQGCSHPPSVERGQAYRAGFTAGRAVTEQVHSRQGTQDNAGSQYTAPPPNTGSIFGKVLLAGAALGSGGALLGWLLRDKPTYDKRAERYRGSDGKFKRG